MTHPRIVQEGVDPKKVDNLVRKFGFPVGSVTLMDEVGIDVGMHVSNTLSPHFGEKLLAGDPEMIKALVDAGLLGKFILLFHFYVLVDVESRKSPFAFHFNLITLTLNWIGL